jgi:nitrite reductase (NADH) large subunit
MYYIATADRLMRTATWLDKMEGGIEHLRDVVIHDRLGIGEQLERDMQHLVDTYRCEWAEVVNNPELRARFRHFANSTDEDQEVQFVVERGQRRPVDWPKKEINKDDSVGAPSPTIKFKLPVLQTSWVRVARVTDVPKEGGIAIRHGKAQIALFNFASRGEWYATQNTCPHMKEAVLARGLIGDQAGKPKVACPIHKKAFSLESGDCLSGDSMHIRTFPVKVQDGAVYVELPPVEIIEQMVPCGHEHPDASVEALDPAPPSSPSGTFPLAS